MSLACGEQYIRCGNDAALLVSAHDGQLSLYVQADKLYLGTGCGNKIACMGALSHGRTLCAVGYFLLTDTV